MNNQNMNSISPRRLGLAFGLTGVVFYLACILTMITAPYDKQIVFFNSLLHGIDVSPILRRACRLAKCCWEPFSPSSSRGLPGHGCRLLQFDRREGTKMNDCRERSSMAGNQGTPDVLHALLLLTIIAQRRRMSKSPTTPADSFLELAIHAGERKAGNDHRIHAAAVVTRG